MRNTEIQAPQIFNDHPSEDFFDYSLYSGSLNNLLSSPRILINTINQYSYCIAEEDECFKKSLQQSDILLPDGIAVVAAARFLTGKKVQKIAGADIHEHLLSELNEIGGRCFYLGASENTLNKIKNRLKLEYPSIRVGSYSPPYKPKFSAHDNRLMIDAVNVFLPDVLFVGMTAPKQEKWVYEHNDQLNSKIICTIGAVFDFYGGTVQRPHKVWISLGLEWFIRLVKEPKRLWRRYVYYGPVFIWHMLKEKKNLIRSKKKGRDVIIQAIEEI